MGLFDFLSKPKPKEIAKRIQEAVAKSEDFAQRGDKENALKVLLENKEFGWGDMEYMMHVAAAYYRAGYHPEAIECNRRAIELNPDYGRIYINMGRAYFALNDYANAASSYAQAIRLIEEKPQCNHESDHPIACAWYGASLAMTGKKEEGEAYIKKAEEEGYQQGDGLRKVAGITGYDSRVGKSEKIYVADTNTPDTLRMRELYQKLADTIWETIPEEWSKIYFHGEVLPDSRYAYFFYERPSEQELTYCHSIPRKCNVDKRTYEKRFLDILHWLAELNKEYAANFEKVWTNFTLILENNGKFCIKYGYEDFRNNGFHSWERQKIWMYEVIGIEPEDDEGKALIKRYLDSKEKK